MKKPEMEEESKSQEPFLKIERTWSEAEPNFENITVKEEDISDIEPETLLKELEENCNYVRTADKCVQQSDVGTKDNLEEVRLSKNDEDIKKKGKSKGNGVDLSATCQHDAKNFKVVKKRLRCSDCKSILCPECYCTISSSLQMHFSKSDNNNKRLYPCKLCNMIFRANCALQAHIRIHLLDTPYVCPDCGAIYNNIYFLSLHLINKCYHVYKVVTNGCKFCLSQNMSPEDYISHIEKSHIKPVYKCLQCGLIFENTTDMNRHLGSSHKNESVMSLSYFSCSMCGNLKISKHLYAKHIKYHRDHSAAFQIGYLCSCGHSFNTACSFRTHFKNCSKKGILPPQWTYLQVTLKTHEMLQVQSAIQKSTFLQSESGLISNPADSNDDFVAEKRQLNYCLFEDGDSSEECEEASEGSHMNISNDSVLDKTKVGEEDGRRTEPDNVSCASDVGSKISNENKIDREEKCEKRLTAEEGRNEAVKVDSAKSFQKDVAEIIREPTANKDEIIREKTSNVQATDESQDGSGLLVHPERGRGNESGDRTLKVVYDHIPCDHLGYLKTQQSSEVSDKNIGKDESESARNGEFVESSLVSSSDSYIITSVLDEKTGVMRTRKVFIQKSHSDRLEVDGTFDVDNSEGQNRETQKSRSGTFFSCPFCSVLFPKHFSSFHRFRLHLECYHPEAALDITVDRTQLPRSQTPFSSIKRRGNDLDSDSDVQDLDDVDLQTRLNSLTECNREENSGNVNLHTSESSNDGSSHGESANPGNKRKGLPRMRRTEQHEFDSSFRSVKSVEEEHREDVQIKSNPRENQCRKNSFIRKINENFRTALSQNVSHLKVNDYTDESCEQGEHSTSARGIEDVDENSESLDSEICSSYNKATKLKDDCDNDLEGSDIKDKKVVNKISAKNTRVGEYSLSDDRRISDFHDYSDDKNHESKQDFIGSRGLRVKNGREHHRSDVGDFDVERSENVKEENGGRSAERKNSRRESDVWSEFYKTLKIAETLKKTKVKNQEGEDAPILTNYANKRVVKKPKRYRESSDSEESNEGESSRFDPEDEELYAKKKKLLDRLENVDYRILDYIFKMLERKQKNCGFVKKNTETKGLNRKLINGGKILGKQQKTSPNIEEGEEDKELSDCNGEELDWDLQTGTSTDDKGDKRRGRPRKTDPLMLRERRRSDYEKEAEKNIEGDDEFYMKKKKRKLSNKLQYYKKMLEKKDFSSGQVISTIKDSDTDKKLTCAVCKESHQTETEFREHIQTHRMDENSHQCMECGECFVVRPSLEKHLHAFHKIKDVPRYIEENECSTLDKMEEFESEPLKENQCKVCKDQFPTVHDLNKHFRIHGMAFLRQFKKDPKSN